MFTTSLTAIAVASLLASNATVGQPTWQTDYAKAIRVSGETQKPVAVFITSGGQDQLLNGGTFGPEVAKMLREKFVPLHVDTSTTAGKQLAVSFELRVGLVISDAKGGLQALRHDGTLTGEALKTYLEQFAGSTTVTTTVSNSATVAPTAVPAVSGSAAATLQYQYAPSRCVGGNCGQVQYLQPQYSQPTGVQAVSGQQYAPAPAFMYGAPTASTCRNGKCGR